MPFRSLNICLDLLRVRAAINIDVSHAGHGEEFEGVFEERSACEWEQTLTAELASCCCLFV